MTSPRSLQISFWCKYEASKTDLVEAQKQEISQIRAQIGRKWWNWVNDNAVHGGHGFKIKVWRRPREQLDHSASHAPNITCAERKIHINSTILFHRLSIPREANHLNNFWCHPIGGAYNLSMRSRNAIL